MARPLKHRCIAQEPLVDYFKPRGIPLEELEEVSLALDEFEALRLADLRGLYQEVACRRMQVSRATFGNILTSAHRKIAEAIINGKAIRIEGRVYNTGRKNRCRRKLCCLGAQPQVERGSMPCGAIGGTGKKRQSLKCKSKVGLRKNSCKWRAK